MPMTAERLAWLEKSQSILIAMKCHVGGFVRALAETPGLHRGTKQKPAHHGRRLAGNLR